MKKLLTIILSVLIYVSTVGQTPKSPTITGISSESGKVMLFFTHSNTSAVGFIIYYKNYNNQWVNYDTLFQYIGSYTFNKPFKIDGTDTYFDPNKTVLHFAIEAFFQSNPNIVSSDNIKPTSKGMANIVMKADFDSCNRAIILSWNKQDVNFVSKKPFFIYQSGNTNPLATKDTSVSKMSLPDPNGESSFIRFFEVDKKEYSFYMQQFGENNINSVSNILTYTPPVPKLPDNIYAQSLEPNSNGFDISFKIDSSSEYRSFTLESSKNPNAANGGGFTEVEKNILLPEGSNILTYSYVSDTTIKNIFFRLACKTECKTFYTSEVLTNLNLRTYALYDSILLNWDAYTISTARDIVYDVYRIRLINGETLIEKLKDSYSTTVYAENVADIPELQVKEDLTYYIVARDKNDNNFLIKSNQSTTKAQIRFDVFTGFTPNGDGKNDEFKPNLGSLIPKSYTMIIIDRWGNKIFETTDKNKGWNGKVKSGTKAPDGVYLYYIKIIGTDGSVTEKSGYFNMVIP